jgi:uncharacterized membrane protein
VVHAVIFSVVSRVMRSMTLAEALIVAAIVVVAFLAVRARRIYDETDSVWK